jgi:hypothetical protein
VLKEDEETLFNPFSVDHLGLPIHLRIEERIIDKFEESVNQINIRYSTISSPQNHNESHIILWYT